MHNNVPHDSEKGEKKKIKGNVYLGSLDFTYNKYNWIARGNIDYGYVSNAKEIAQLSYPNVQYVKPYESGNGKYFGSHAMAMMLEVGYDIFSQIHKLREDNQRLMSLDISSTMILTSTLQPNSGPTEPFSQQVSTTILSRKLLSRQNTIIVT